MRTLSQLVSDESMLPVDQEGLDWLHLLLADWQVLADLSGADLVLWLPATDGGFVAAALCRTGTSATVHLEDIVGLRASQARAEALTQAYQTGKPVEASNITWSGSYSVQVTCIPVMRDGVCVAVLSREENYGASGGALGGMSWSKDAADLLLDMVAQGDYPYDTTPTVTSRGVPRVNDGVILLDSRGVVEGITPNANSCMRRLGLEGDLVGRSLVEEITEVIRDETVIDETLAVVIMGRASWRVEVEAHAHTVSIRALPLLRNGERAGAILLTRDITETVRREQQLMTKDATIREIHHRVKNNLQTVSALLRMQGRRSESEDVKDALHSAERRVETIATVHAALSQDVHETVDFDDVGTSLLRMAATVAATDQQIEVVITGKFGDVPADAASALATVLTELVTNSVEHGLPGRDGIITVNAQRDGDILDVSVTDDGSGVPEGFVPEGLGTQIVRTMVRGELHGSIEWGPNEPEGTRVDLHLNLGA